MPYCPLCNKPLMMVPSAFPENYCQCERQSTALTIRVTWTNTNATGWGEIISTPLQPEEKTAIPAGILASLEGVDLNV